jgi:alkylhydroperoxidase family enzyme
MYFLPMPSTHPSYVRQTANRAYGIVPNLFQETNRYTGVPGAVYLAADAAMTGTILKPREQQTVLLTLARYHNSRYDAVVHARLALDAGLRPQTIERHLAGAPLPSGRLQALVDATLRSCEERGWLDEESLCDLERRGVTRGDLYEIFAFIGLKTITSFTEHLSTPEVDGPLKSVERSLDHVPDRPDALDRPRLFLG